MMPLCQWIADMHLGRQGGMWAFFLACDCTSKAKDKAAVKQESV